MQTSFRFPLQFDQDVIHLFVLHIHLTAGRDPRLGWTAHPAKKILKEVAIFYDEGGETLERVAQRGGRCPNPANIQGQVGQGSEQPDPVEDVPAHCRGAGLDDL